MGLPAPWIRNIPNDGPAQEALEGAVRNSTTAVGRLKEILMEDLAALERADTSIAQFDTPDWSHKQAFWNGQRSMIKQLLNLLTF